MTNKENDTDAVKSSKRIGDAKIDVTLGVDFNCGDMYFFYSDFLLWTIEKCSPFQPKMLIAIIILCLSPEASAEITH